MVLYVKMRRTRIAANEIAVMTAARMHQTRFITEIVCHDLVLRGPIVYKRGDKTNKGPACFIPRESSTLR